MPESSMATFEAMNRGGGLENHGRKHRGFESLSLRHASFVLLGVALAACQSASPGPSSIPNEHATPTPAPWLFGAAQPVASVQTYRSVSFTQDGRDALLPGTHVELRLWDSGSIGAFAGCNHLGGDFNLTGGRLLVPGMSMTLIGCPPERAAQDSRVEYLLESSPTLTVNGDSLVLQSGGMTMNLVSEASAPTNPLVGTGRYMHWRLDGVEPPGDPIRIPAGVLDLSLGDQGEFNWTMSLCGAGGSYSLASDQSIDFKPGDRDVTDDPCGPLVQEIDGMLRDVSAAKIPFSLEADTLVLTGTSVLLTFTRHAEPTPMPNPRNRWLADTLDSGSGPTALPDTAAVELTQWTEGSLTWSVGTCANGQADYTAIDNHTLDFQPQTGGIQCTGKAAEVEAAVRTLLSATDVHYQSDGRALRFSSGTIQLVLHATD
jgi:heat shock protein HslJ